MNLLGWGERALADAFAGLAPAPGGPFTLGRWRSSEWGPVLDGGPGWLGVRVLNATERAGWALLVRGLVEHVEPAAWPVDGVLAHVRGRYHGIAGGGATGSAGNQDS